MEAPFFARWSANSLPFTPQCPGIHCETICLEYSDKLCSSFLQSRMQEEAGGELEFTAKIATFESQKTIALVKLCRNIGHARALQCAPLYQNSFGGSLPQINLGVQGVTQEGHHSGAQRVNPEFRVRSNFRIIPEQYFSGVENVVEFLENVDNNLTYYEIPTQLACAYLKGHLTGRALDWFEVLGYRVVKDKATDYAYLKQALSEQFPVVRNRSEQQTSFYSSSQKHNQKQSDFVYDLLKIHKIS
ncbi:uncharacterized protein TNCV_2584001 [Trichonephila clavipes]|nr:uncharacterized protein TNCV_2584001 [Trichonephila clavipes]